MNWLTIKSARDGVVSGQWSAVELTRDVLKSIEALNPELNAFLYVDAEGALAQAAHIDQLRAKQEPLPLLAGVPVALKDNLCTRGVPTTCASRILEGYIPPYDAYAVQKLRQSGAILVGKTNMDEFAMGSSNENSAFGPCHNPWNTAHAPGGSSGGSAAAVAAGCATLALGSDTGGSVRQPAAFCGVVAIKPTYGRVSRYGLVAFASSLDQIGPFARSVEDAAWLLEVIAGVDAHDATSVDQPVDNYAAAAQQSVKGLRVGVFRKALEEGTDPSVVNGVEDALRTLQNEGCTLVDVELPHAEYGVAAYYLVAPAEASSNLARFDGMRYGLRKAADDLGETYAKSRAAGFGPEVRRRIMLGTYALSAGYYDAFYLKAQKVRTLIAQDFAQAFAGCDLIVTPTAPTPAFALNEKADDPLAMYLADIFTLPPSLAGLPAISVPCGFSPQGLPVGVQLIGPAFTESMLIRAGSSIERGFEGAGRKPPVWAAAQAVS